MLKVTLVQEYLIFHETDNELVNEYIEQNEMLSFKMKGKLHVKAKPEQLYLMLWNLTNEIDITII